MLKRYGLQKCEVKDVALSPLKEQPKANELDTVYGRLKTKETDEAGYYVQKFKISCADEKYSNVLELGLTSTRVRNIFLNDIDVTMDYSDKEEVIHQKWHKIHHFAICPRKMTQNTSFSNLSMGK